MAVRHRIGPAVSALMLAATAWAADPAPAPPAAPAAPAHGAAAPFAVVGDTVVSAADYQRALQVAMRKKYYHAKPPEAEFAKFQREVGEEVVNRVLLLAEARRRGVQPDRDQIKATIAGYDQQYKGSANWAANREKMLASVTPALESESVMERFEKIVRTVPEPSEAAAREYYDKHKDLFVEPEQVKMSVILLKVDPSSRQEVWNGAHAEAKAVHKKLVGGADFGELARLHSGDRSAARGGEMEYVHRGMLPEALHGAVDKMVPGNISEPVQLLEGVAILRLDGRKPAAQRAFEQVKARAAELWKRAEADARWAALIADLRRNTKIRIDESQYGPLRGAAEKARTG
jgi:parvulin-like peptidyl-prolyl isomerase